MLYMKTNIHFWSYLTQFLSEWKMFHIKVVEKIKTHILCSITFPRKWCHLWDNVGKYGTAGQATDDSTIRRMRIACWIPKATDIHFEYVITCFSTATTVTRTRLDITLHIHCLSCWKKCIIKGFTFHCWESTCLHQQVCMKRKHIL